MSPPLRATLPRHREKIAYICSTVIACCVLKTVILVAQRRAFLQQWHQYPFFVSFVTILSFVHINKIPELGTRYFFPGSLIADLFPWIAIAKTLIV